MAVKLSVDGSHARLEQTPVGFATPVSDLSDMTGLVWVLRSPRNAASFHVRLADQSLHYVMLHCSIERLCMCSRSASHWAVVQQGFIPMSFMLSHLLRDFLSQAEPHDEHLLAGAAEESLQALGVSQPVLARFQNDMAVLCPDLLHETQLGLVGK